MIDKTSGIHVKYPAVFLTSRHSTCIQKDTCEIDADQTLTAEICVYETRFRRNLGLD